MSFIPLAALVACGRRPAPASPEPPIFPVTKKWVAFLDTASEIQGPLASDGTRLFVSTREAIFALDRASGRVLWRSETAGLLTAAAGVVIVRSDSGQVTSLEPATGRTRWQAATGSTGPVAAVIDGVRILVAGSRLVGLDTASGKTVLDEALSAPATTPPVKLGQRLLLGEGPHLRARDASTMQIAWSFTMERPLEAAPTIDGNRILIGTGDRRAIALKTNGKLDWQFKIGTSVPVPPAAAGGHALVAASEAVLYALTRGSGHMAWRAPLPSRPLGPPLVIGRQVVVACHPDELLAFDVETGKPEGTARAGIERLGDAGPSEIRAAPLVLDGSLYVAVRNPSWAVVALERGTPPAAPEPPAPFEPEAALQLGSAEPSPAPANP